MAIPKATMPEIEIALTIQEYVRQEAKFGTKRLKRIRTRISVTKGPATAELPNKRIKSLSLDWFFSAETIDAHSF